jgi:hypothetical protein
VESSSFQIPLTDVEQDPANVLSGANLFNVPEESADVDATVKFWGQPQEVRASDADRVPVDALSQLVRPQLTDHPTTLQSTSDSGYTSACRPAHENPSTHNTIVCVRAAHSSRSRMPPAATVTVSWEWPFGRPGKQKENWTGIALRAAAWRDGIKGCRSVPTPKPMPQRL